MDAVSYSHSAKQAQRIKKIIANPDSSSGIVTVPKVIASGETITIPAGRVAVLPNVVVDGTLNIDGEVFIPSGATLGDLDAQLALKADTSYVNAQLGLKANTADLKEIGVNQTVQTFTVGTQRVAGTTYTNSTGKPIEIYIYASSAGGGWQSSLTVNGILTQVIGNTSNQGEFMSFSSIIPNGATYVVGNSGAIISSWKELR